jgi:hypothetical protein
MGAELMKKSLLAIFPGWLMRLLWSLLQTEMGFLNTYLVKVSKHKLNSSQF